MKHNSLQTRIKKQKDRIPSSLSTLQAWKCAFGLPPISSLIDKYKNAYGILVGEILAPFVNDKNEESYQSYQYVPYHLEVEHKNYIKSWTSILDKILRTLEAEEENKRSKKKLEKKNIGNKITNENSHEFFLRYLREMTDIVRCRILCNFEKDLEDIDKLLQSNEFKRTVKEYGYEYKQSNRKDNRIKGGKSLEHTSHRAIHHFFEIQVEGDNLVIEVQLMTFLQNAWDTKQHIIYEMIRREKPSEALVKINERYKALSALLMIADEFADDTHKKYIKLRGQ